MNGKRKPEKSQPLVTPPIKKTKLNANVSQNHEESAPPGVVLRKYYPPEMSQSRIQAYIDGDLPKPIDLLNSALSHTKAHRVDIDIRKAVVHWFKSDLRIQDNRGLSLASQKAKEKDVPLISLYVFSLEDLEAHLRAPIRVDFTLRTLKILQNDLAKLDIPLYVETVEKRKAVPARITELLEQWGACHLYANAEYEVDELRREAGLVRSLAQKNIAFEVIDDSCVVTPGDLSSGTGKQYSVYTPWFKSWMAHIHTHPTLLDLSALPEKNPSSARENYAELFDTKIPEAPPNKALTAEQKRRFHAMWPAGEKEAQARLEKFCKERIGQYAAKRNFPAETGTSNLSVHFAVGTLSARMAVRRARETGSTKKLDGGGEGVKVWISEVAWRDFYRHVLVAWPHVCMNKPFKPAYSHITWERSSAHLAAWKAGKTGYPIVDAAMRQLAHTGWMHNRLRMVTASFLAKHLLLDWRLGEQYFMLNLIDGDFASNNGGWGWSASSGVDPQPYFRVFNPELQSEKFDKEGIFIRKWVPELEAVKGNKAIHDPYGRGAGKEAKMGGYPERIVKHKESRERCLVRYKEGLAKGD